MKNLVFDNDDKVVVRKLSVLSSQHLVEQVLEDFMSSSQREVCVLIASTMETTRKIINHVRIMIEEAEGHSSQTSKLFVLLLHFPPSQFFEHCYPAFFVDRWDHCYLDTIAQNTENSIIDIQDWLHRCCFTDEKAEVVKTDSFLSNLKRIIPQLIPVLLARLYFGQKNDASFNSAMNATERSEALRTLLLKKGLCTILCSKFETYWKPDVMLKYLKNAAEYNEDRESTLNITDTIHEKFKSLFLDFCVYMLTRANSNYNLDIIYSSITSESCQSLFLKIFEEFPMPELDQLHFRAATLPRRQRPEHCPQFPFFTDIFMLVEKHVQSCHRSVNIQLDLMVDRAQQLVVGSSYNIPTDRAHQLHQKIMKYFTSSHAQVCS